MCCVLLLQGLAGTLDETFTLAGQVVVQLAENAAIAMKSAQKALDDMLPGPDMQDVIVGLRWVVTPYVRRNTRLQDKPPLATAWKMPGQRLLGCRHIGMMDAAGHGPLKGLEAVQQCSVDGQPPDWNSTACYVTV